MAEGASLHSVVLSALAEHIAVLDRRGRIVAVNEAWNRFAAENGDPTFLKTGVGQSYLEVCKRAQTATAEAAMAGIQALLAGTQSQFDLEYPCHSPARQRWFQLRATALPGLGGVVAAHLEITRRKRAEDHLRVEFAVAQALAGASTLAQVAAQIVRAVCEGLDWDVGTLWEVESTARVLRCVDFWHHAGGACDEFDAATRASAFPRGIGLPGRVWASAQPAWIAEVGEDPNFPRAAVAVRSGLHAAFGFPIVLGGDVLGVIEFFSREIRQPDPQLLEMLGVLGSQIGQFIERRQAEKRFQDLLEFAPDALVVVDGQGRILLVNRQAEVVFGYVRDELVGRSVEMLTPEAVREHHVHLRAAFMQSAVTRPMGAGRDLRARHKDGHEFPVEISLSPLETPEGVVIVSAIRDITRRKELEDRLAQAQRLESIGQLSAGIAHEINTPMQFVGDNAHFLQGAVADLGALLSNYKALLAECRQGRVPSGRLDVLETALTDKDADYLIEQSPRALRSVLEGVTRVSTLVRAMKAFSHPGEEEKSLVDLNGAVEMTLIISRNEWKYVAEVVTNLDPTLPPVLGVPGQLNQVLLNLVVNAAHAIADIVGDGSRGKGTITVTTRGEGPWAEIRIADTGIGIPEAIRDRIFDRFFTTKEVGKGTGQGLAIVRSIVVSGHGGTVEFETQVGRGTAFILRFPFAPSPAEGSGSQVAVS